MFTQNPTYNQCISMAAWFVESQTEYLPIVLVPEELYKSQLSGIIAINPAECPPFKVRPYKGKFIITIPDMEKVK